MTDDNTAFDLPPEVASFREVVKRFAMQEVEPLVDQAEENERFPLELFRKAGDEGLLGLQFSTDYGGAETGLLPDLIVREELSYVCAGISAGLGIQGQIGTAYLAKFGTDEQCKRWLSGALAGEIITSWAVTEPDAGSDIRGISTKARREGDGWVLNGRKAFITNGPIADIVGVVARLEDSERFGVFVVEREDEGYSCERSMKKLGLRSSEVGELVFDDIRLDDDRRLSPEGGSHIQDILDVLIKGRVLIAGAAIGVAQRAFDLALEYAKQRYAFGRPIGRFQEISLKFAEADTDLQAARLLTYKAAHLCDTHEEIPVRECAHAKLFASEMAVRVVDQMIRVFGGMGFMREVPIERLYRDVRYFPIVEGTTEIQHRILSKELGL